MRRTENSAKINKSLAIFIHKCYHMEVRQRVADMMTVVHVPRREVTLLGELRHTHELRFMRVAGRTKERPALKTCGFSGPDVR